MAVSEFKNKSEKVNKTFNMFSCDIKVYNMSMYSPFSALFILLTAQNLPHIEQVSSCSGARLSRIDLAVSGSIEHSHCFSQSKVRLASAIWSSISLAWGIFLAISAA